MLGSMAGSHSLRVMLFTCLLAVLLLATPARAEDEKCSAGEVHDSDGECCSPDMIDLVEGEEKCFEDPGEMSVAVAFTLIGSFTFMISLSFATNHPDVDMKKYAYGVISSTVSIFVAVLMFQCFNGIIEHWLIEKIRLWSHDNLWYEFYVDLAHFVFWYIVTQLMLARSSGALKKEQVRIKLENLKNSVKPEERQKFKEEKEYHDGECMSWGIIMAHLTGFAAINCWTGLQQCPPFDKSPLMALIPFILALVTQQILQRLTNKVRETVMKGDGIKDTWELKWDDACEEAENDVLGLTLSVTLVNVVRFAINGMVKSGVGCMPNQEQKEEGEGCEEFVEEKQRSATQLLFLFLAGFCFVTCLFFVKYLQEKFFGPSKEEEEGEEEGEESDEDKGMAERIAESTVISLAMAFSWCSFHANRQLLIFLNPDFLGDEKQETSLQLVLALEVSVLAFFVIRILDMISDLDDRYTPPAVDHSIESVIAALALFIGFAWEQTFDVSVDSLAAKARKIGGPHARDYPAIAKFVIGLCISTFVFSAWKWYIIPIMVKKGYRYTVVYNVTELKKVIKDLGEEEKENEDLKALNDLVEKEEEAEKAGTSVTDALYRALPSDELEGLRAKNRELMARLTEAEEEKAKAQNMLNTHMENMLVSLKKMNDTVTKIEGQ